MNKRKFELWFFRDLTDEQRFALFRLHGVPVGEKMTLGQQQATMNYIFTHHREIENNA